MTATLPVSRPRESGPLVLSEAQAAVLRFLRLNVRATPDTLVAHSEGTPGTLSALLHLGLAEQRRAGARDPLLYLTPLGWHHLEATLQDDDPPGGRQPSDLPLGPYDERSNIMNATATPEAPAAAPTATKADLNPLYKEIVATLKKLVSGKSEAKAAYARINAKNGRTVAYVNLPTSRSVRVEIPRAGASGYDVIKATSSDDVAKIVKAVEAFIAARDELAAKKEAEKAAASAPAA